VYSPDIEWSVPTEIVKVYPDGITSHKVIMTPSKYVEPGWKGIKLNIKDTSTDEIAYSEVLEVNLKSSEIAVSSYRPSVAVIANLPEYIDPRESVFVTVKLENQNLLNLSNLIFRVTSSIDEFDFEKEMELLPLGKKILELNYSLYHLQEPGDYLVTFEVIKQGEVIGSVEKGAYISTIPPSFDEKKSTGGYLLKKVETKKITSKSNVETTQTLKIPVSFLKDLFVSTQPRGKAVVEDGQRYIAVDVKLKPGEEKEILIITNYRILVYILAVILILLGIHYRYKSPLKIRKGVSDVDAREGGVSELKVTLEITSDSKRPIKNVTITDYIPNIADIQKEFGEGTIKPSRVFKHAAKGTVLKWEIDEIAPGEDRLINYNIKSKLSVVGQFDMPRAKVEFKKGRRRIVSYSNKVGVSS